VEKERREESVGAGFSRRILFRLEIAGWAATDATALQTAIASLSGVDLEQEASKAKGPA